ncbi:CHAT domain-containing protein [Nonomuraea polychroma]|uniref:CHAT domain-containing protein n=1 Tax=Nonomuraea polychroma TaxID=46176 RepID=A0A438M8W6_9ACTN|nr:CHAT domain-containing protein [Nonomuraea polychroma]RVX42138.1 CHAT domain-containing protein [Nonomuraea polychroma]
MNPEVHIAKFLQTRDLRELESGIAAYHREIARDPDPLLLTGLGNAMSMRFDTLGQEGDLAEAVALHRRAVAALAGKPGLAEAQASLAAVLGNHRQVADTHLDEVLELYASALRGDLVDRPLVLANHGMALVLGYQITGDRRFLLDGIDALRASVRGTDPDHDAYLWRLAKLASALVMANDSPEGTAELKEALDVIRERYAEAPEPVKQEIQLLVGVGLHADEIPVIPPELWEQIRRGMADLPSGPQARPGFLAGLGRMLIEDVRRSGKLERADQAAEVLRQAVAQMPPGYSELAELYIGLGVVLGLRMEFSGTHEDLDDMIDALRRGVAAARPGDDNAGMYHSDLGNGLMLKFRLGGGLTVLDEAIACFRRGLAISPEHPERAMAYTSLGSALFFKYELTGDMPDLDEAIESHRTARSLTAPEHANYALYLANLGGALEQRYKVTRRGEDSEEAAKVLREAVAATPETSPYRPGHLANLAEVLLERYRFTGQTAAREEADELLREAVGTVHPGNIQAPGVLNSLGSVLMQRDGHIDEAIVVLRRAHDAAPARTWTRTLATVNLATALLLRSTSEETPKAQLAAAIRRLLDPAAEKGTWRKLLRRDRRVKETPDLDEAVALFTEAIKADPPGGPVAYNGLGLALRTRYALTGKPRTLLQAVHAARTAAETSAPDDSTRSIALYYLAEVLVEQWELTRAETDRDEALARYREATQVETASADWRASVGKRWGEVAMEAGLAGEAVEGFAVAVAALDEAAWRGLGRADQERILGEYESLARDAAAAAIRTGDADRALELLEQGRGVMFAQVIGDRAGHDRLRAAAPELADRFGEVQDELDAAERMDLYDDLAPSSGHGTPGLPGVPGTPGGPGADRRRLLDHRHTLARRRREVLEEIRRLPGFTGFLRPPRAADLLRAAEDGPIAMVNVSRHGCDALLVTTEGVRVVPLDFTASAAQDQADRFVDALHGKVLDEVASCLDWLWTHVTGPVLEALGPLRRIWWCPTGPLTLLPLHAAGSALDLVVSSYTPTLRALIHARGQSGPRAERRVLLVGVPEVPGDAAVKGVVRELEAARRWLPGARELTEDDATCEQVLTALDDSAWVHFACHAAQLLNDPSHARLILHDRPLTVRELAARRLGQAELAFLSGCETSRGGAVLTDEAVSIASAIQLAGFPHVIGTLWPIADVHAPAVVDEVYAMLTAGGTREPHPHGAAAALHAAVHSLRHRRPDFPIFWAPYVHIGP